MAAAAGAKAAAEAMEAAKKAAALALGTAMRIPSPPSRGSRRMGGTTHPNNQTADAPPRLQVPLLRPQPITHHTPTRSTHR